MSISHPVSPQARDTTPSVPATDLRKGEAADHAFSLEEEVEEGHRIRSAASAAMTSSEEEHTYIHTYIHCYIIGVCMHAYG